MKASFRCQLEQAVVPELMVGFWRRLAVNLERCELVIEVLRIQITLTVGNELNMME